MYPTSYQIQARAELERRKRLGLLPEPKPLWEPNPDRDGIPNPQRLAYESEADILGYGGAGGSGKSDLGLGFAATKHRNSVIFRRKFKNLRGMIERSRQVFNPDGSDHSKDRFNESLHRWVLSDGKIIEFESCQYEKDKEDQRGRPRDLYVFDEATEFTKSQIEFITAWNRSVDPNQKCRVLLTFNPPSEEEGMWVIDYFLPWIAYLFPDDYTHPNPAKPGELRWYATIDGEEIECENGLPFEHGEEIIRPRSRTFIPGKLADNPHLANTNYGSILQSLPEPLRSQVLHGNFAAAKVENPFQVIPTQWVRLAQKRWEDIDKPLIPMSAMGVDVSRGGKDKSTIAKRYENYIDEIVRYPGVMIYDGPALAAMVKQEIEKCGEPETLNIDVIGVGSSPYDSLKDMYDFISPINVAEKSSYRDRSGKYGMKNKRAEAWWRMREALDPDHGDNMALPPDNELLADLCSAIYIPSVSGIQIEEKKKIKERIGRSPDLGECVLLTMLEGSKWMMGWE